jgi:hypothetical protein
MEPAESSPPAEVSRVAVRFPPFWAERPAVWFTQAEVQFFLAGISSERTTFFHVISQLDQRYATEVEDIITSPPERDPYTTLRAELVKRLSPSTEQRIHQLLTLEEMGNRKPSQFLRQLRSLAPDLPDGFLCSVCASRLPSNIRTVLAGQPEVDLDTAASCAGRIMEAAPQPSLASVTPLPEKAALQQQVEDLRRQVAALNAELNRSRSRSSYGTPRTSSRNSPETKLHPAFAGTTAVSEPRRKNVPSPAPTASRETNATDIIGGTCLLYIDRPPLH